MAKGQTKKAPGGGSAAEAVAERLIGEQTALLEAADVILLRHAAACGEEGLSAWDALIDLSPEEAAVFASIGWDRDAIRREFGRAGRVVVWKNRAGSAKAFDAAKKRAEAAAGRGEELRDLRRQVAELEDRIHAIERECEDAGAAVAAMAQARAKLSEDRLLPAHVLKRVQAERARLRRRFFGELSGLRDRKAILERTVRAEAGSDAALHLAEKLPKNHPAHPRRRDIGGGLDELVVRPEAWRAHQAEAEAELSGVAKRLEAIEGEYKTALAAVDKLCEHYIN